MDGANWVEPFNNMQKWVVKVELNNSFGTGILMAQREFKGKNEIAIATAYHVIKNTKSDFIKITHYSTQKKETYQTNKSLFLHNLERDLCLMILEKRNFILPTEEELLIMQDDKILVPGVQIGWCGFPGIIENNLCFFSGHISSILKNSGDYLVDGTAINGVSGGPAFFKDQNKAVLIGIVTNYIPNLATGLTLPGLSLIRCINPYTKFFDFKS